MIELQPKKKVEGRVTDVLKAAGDDFISQSVAALALTYDGIEGDYHVGLTRRSGGREPWYPRGTEMRNERQVSLLSVEELAEIAAGLGIDRLDPGWIGGNVILEGIPNMTFLPPRALLLFEGGVTLRVDGYNGPCRLAGGAIAERTGVAAPDGDYTRSDLALAFKSAAYMKRGLVAWVEREGEIRPGERVTARLWEQWIY